MVCHAMSIAMTVVLPAPVAIFRASRGSQGSRPRWRLDVSKYVRILALTSGHLREPDRCFDRFDLAEERARAVPA